MKSHALPPRFNSVFRHAPAAPTLLRSVRAPVADEDGDWDAVIARAKMRQAPPQADDDEDWDTVIARAKTREPSLPADDDEDWDAVIARAKMRQTPRPSALLRLPARRARS